MTPRCRQLACDRPVPLAGVTCAQCVRHQAERTPRTLAGRRAVAEAHARRAEADRQRQDELRRGLAKVRAAHAAAQGGLW